MAKVTVKDSFGDVHEFPECGFRTDDSGTNNLEVFVESDRSVFAAFAEGFWVSAVVHDG